MGQTFIRTSVKYEALFQQIEIKNQLPSGPIGAFTDSNID
jgi:hypothetical protein